MNLDAEYAEYRSYIEEFAKTIDPHDQLPLRVSGYCLRDYEIHGEIIEWLIIYLGRACPTTLRIYLIRTALKRILEKVQDSPDECGYDESRAVFQPLKLVKVVVAVVNNLIFDLQDNAKLYEVPLPPSSTNATELTKLTQPPKVSVDAIKNTRRAMEDRHVIIEDFNGFFNTQDTEPTFYYGIFDGHSGTDAATYANSHLNYNISVHPSYPSDIKKAMGAAFLVTDIEFLKKAEAENLHSGTTALCAIYRKTQKKLFVGWCGDSQALIARLGSVHQIVNKHSAEDAAERKRIEDMGGVVLYWGNSYRVNGSLAVTRAIGDHLHKPYVSAEPDIAVLDLDGEEDFFVMGCDGLWDALTEDDVALTVYKRLKENPDNYRKIASELCALAKSQGSRDNISVIVVFLKEPELIATQNWPLEAEHKDTMENLNLYESEQVVAPAQQPAVVSMDALGNTNQDIFNNPFGDFNNQIISDVTMAKSTEITDMVMQQQPENEFCTLTDTLTSSLNSINNNKIINGSHEVIDNFGVNDGEELQQQQQQQPHSPLPPHSDPSAPTLNDDNNNSNDNFPDMGPETDVDAIEDDDEDFQYKAGGEVAGVGEKEKTQMEFKETDDVTDHMSFGGNVDIAMVGNALENKVFEELSLHNPDLMMMGGGGGGGGGSFNPFGGNENDFIADSPASEIFSDDNKPNEQQIDEMQHELKQEIEREIDFVAHEQAAAGVANAFADGSGIAFELERELISANVEMNTDAIAIEHQAVAEKKELLLVEEEERQEQQQQMPDLGIIGATQGIEESDGSDDEWNYVKVKEADKKDSAAVIEESITEQPPPPTIESSTVVAEHKAEEEEEKEEAAAVEEKEDNHIAPIEATAVAAAVFDNVVVQSEFEENLIAESDNKFVEQCEQRKEEEEEEQQLLISSREQRPVEEDLAQQEESSPIVEEERHIQDEIEKDLQLEVDTEEANDMDSQLNPDAKEFVPLSPVRNEFASPPPSSAAVENGKISPFVNPILSNFSDTVVSQSPRKNDALIMEDVQVPEESDFDKEASERPHEVDVMDDNFERIDSPANDGELNLKEAMQVDDKLEQEYKDDSHFFEEEKQQAGEEYEELEKSFSQYSNGFQNKIDDAMNRSFYEGRDSDILADPAKNVLNTTQPLPDEDDLVQVQSEQREADLLGGGEPVVSQMESSDNFEVEKFVEEIKGADENKYVDSGLSPTIPEFPATSTNLMEAVEETIIATHSTPLKEEVASSLPDTFITETLTAAKIETPDVEPQIEVEHTEINETIPEETSMMMMTTTMTVEQSREEQQQQQEPIVIEDAKNEEPKTEIIAAAATAAVAAAAVGAVAASSAVAKKKSPTSVTGKPDAKKAADTKAKAAPKASTTDAKKPEVKAKMSAASKPASAPVPKTTVSKTSTTQVKASVPSSASATAAAARPKTTAPPLAKKAPVSTASKPAAAPPKTTESKPTPASRSNTTTAPKRTVSASAVTKTAAPKPASDVKAKAAIERKPLASSAPATRAPPKTTSSLAAKPKANGATTAASAKPTATRPTTTTSRLNSSATEKTLSSPLKEKILNKSAPVATSLKSSPRPTTASSTTRTAAAKSSDLKSPSGPAKSSTLSAVGTKKPLTAVKKPSPTEKSAVTKTSTTITKKPATSGSAALKKTSSTTTTTTTTTVVKKKVLNGDIVMEETNTITKTNEGELIPALNGHVNGNGIAENSNGVHDGGVVEEQQQHAEVSLI